MEIQEYQKNIWALLKESLRTGPRKDCELYLIGKLCNESIELLDCLYNREEGILTDGELNKERLADEAGDVCWYLFNLYTLYQEPIPEFFDFVKRNDGYVDPAISLTCQTGEYLGTVMKEHYHGKKILQEVKNDLLNDTYALLLKVLGGLNLSLPSVLDANIKKLRDRHGLSYNENFYKKG